MKIYEVKNCTAYFVKPSLSLKATKKYAKGQIDLHRNELNGNDCPKGNASFMIELIPSFLNWIWPHNDQIFL